MENTKEIINQLDLLNQKVDKYLNPKKMIWNNFVFGISRALGYLFGMIIIASLIAYLLSKIGIGHYITDWIKDNQAILNSQISVPVPDQP